MTSSIAFLEESICCEFFSATVEAWEKLWYRPINNRTLFVYSPLHNAWTKVRKQAGLCLSSSETVLFVLITKNRVIVFFRQMATLYFKKLNQDKTALNRPTKDRANWQRNAAITFSQRAALQALY